MPSRKRSAEDGPVGPTLVVRGRYLRVPELPSWERQAVPKRKAADISEFGFSDASEWATTRIGSGRMTLQAAKDRALLMVSDAQYEQLLEAATKLPSLRAVLPERCAGGCLAENIYVHGDATAHTLCVGDVLEIATASKKSARSVPTHASGLRLQVSSPCQPCSKVDQRFGQRWEGSGVRSLMALILTLILTPHPHPKPSPSP